MPLWHPRHGLTTGDGPFVIHHLHPPPNPPPQTCPPPPCQDALPVEGSEAAAQEPAIRLRYRAREYGKVPTGRLVVATEDMQWTYVVRGVQPEYCPPDKAAMPGHLDNQLAPELSDALARAHQGRAKKNFLVTNMRAGLP